MLTFSSALQKRAIRTMIHVIRLRGGTLRGKWPQDGAKHLNFFIKVVCSRNGYMCYPWMAANELLKKSTFFLLLLTLLFELYWNVKNNIKSWYWKKAQLNPPCTRLLLVLVIARRNISRRNRTDSCFNFCRSMCVYESVYIKIKMHLIKCQFFSALPPEGRRVGLPFTVGV